VEARERSIFEARAPPLKRNPGMSRMRRGNAASPWPSSSTGCRSSARPHGEFRPPVRAESEGDVSTAAFVCNVMVSVGINPGSELAATQLADG